MNTRKNSFFHSFSTSTSRFMKKGRLARAGDLWPERFIFMIHNLQNSFICSAEGLRGFSLNFLALKHLLLFLQSTNPWIWWCQKDRHNSAAHSRSRPTRVKRGGPSLTHRPYPTANFIRLCASAAVGPESREADGCPYFLEKRDKTGAELFIEKAHSAHRFSTIACVLLAQTKDAKIVCVIANNEDADPHTSWTPC